MTLSARGLTPAARSSALRGEDKSRLERHFFACQPPQKPGDLKNAVDHHFFGALDPYVARQNTMIDLTAITDSIPWATFGASALE